MTDTITDQQNIEAQTATDQGAQADTQATQKQWFDDMPDEMKGYIQNKQWDTPLKAIESYRNLEKFQGADKNDILKLPKNENGEYVLDEVYAKLGRPETVDGYKLDAPEGFNVDQERVNTVKQIAHSVGITQKQLDALFKADVEYTQKSYEAYANDLKLQQEADLSDLKREWGQSYEERTELARRFINKNLPDGLNKEETLTKIEEVIGTKAMLKLFGNAGYSIKDDTVPHAGGGATYGMTKEQAIYEKTRLMEDIKSDPARLKEYNEGKKNADRLKIEKYNSLIAF
jgi:hypothetical protein